MKKKVLLISGSLLILSIIIISIFLIINNKKTDVYRNNNIKKDNVNNNFLTFMLEQNDGTYQKSTSNTWPGKDYEFNSTLSICENGGELVWDNNTNTVKLYSQGSDKCYIYFDKKNNIFADECKENNSNTLACHIASLYSTDGNNDIYYHDGEGTYGNLELEDNSYRYSGENPNNFVCINHKNDYGTSCQLYRIIGIFNNDGEYQVKLIQYEYLNRIQSNYDTSYAYKGFFTKGDFLGSFYNLLVDRYYWTKDRQENVNANSFLLNINNNYINYLGDSISNLISNTSWQSTSLSSEDLSNNFKDIYTKEFNSNNKYESKIGLMYLSDYLYASSPANWNNIDNVGTNNWLKSELYDWTLTIDSTDNNRVFALTTDGNIISDYANTSDNGIRPVLYLESNIPYISGNGTINNPYIITNENIESKNKIKTMHDGGLATTTIGSTFYYDIFDLVSSWNVDLYHNDFYGWLNLSQDSLPSYYPLYSTNFWGISTQFSSLSNLEMPNNYELEQFAEYTAPSVAASFMATVGCSLSDFEIIDMISVIPDDDHYNNFDEAFTEINNMLQSNDTTAIIELPLPAGFAPELPCVSIEWDINGNSKLNVCRMQNEKIEVNISTIGGPVLILLRVYNNY